MSTPHGAPGSRKRWLVTAGIVAILLVPFFEIWLLLWVGDRIGLLPTLGLLVGTALLGIWLTRREGTRAWQTLNRTLTRGELPEGQLADAALVLVGGLLLLFPGYVSDLCGLLLLIPFTRRLVRRAFGRMVARSLGLHAAAPGFGLENVRPNPAAYRDGVVVEGEVVDPGPDGEGPRPGEKDQRPGTIPGELDQ